MIYGLIQKYPLISDQIDKSELKVILRELESTIKKSVKGDVVEFGCYKGTTSLFLARLIVGHGLQNSKRLYLYDSFMGLPEKSVKDSSTVGYQFIGGELTASKGDIAKNFAKNNLPRPIIKKAWFSDLGIDDTPDEISFAFFDGDFYESIKDSFRVCSGYLSAGATIIVDDYDSEALPGAARATDEWIKKNESRIANFRAEKSLAVIHLK